jgi:transcriptional regulator with XRE-family HTH domain
MGDKRRNRAKIALLESNLNQTRLARRLNIGLSQVNMVINGRRKTRWIQDAIADALGVSIDALFPPREKKSFKRAISKKADRGHVEGAR